MAQAYDNAIIKLPLTQNIEDLIKSLWVIILMYISL